MFQTLDTKNQCHAVYEDGVFHFDEYKTNTNETWAFHKTTDKPEQKVAQIWANGASLKQCCPADLMEEYTKVEKKLQSFNLAFEAVDFNIEEWCVYDFMPLSFLIDLCEIKNKITTNVLNNYTKPKAYDHMVKVHRILSQMNYNEVLFDFDVAARMVNTKALQSKLRSLRGNNGWVHYDPYGTITGRLSTKPNSFPILNLPAEFKTAIRPHNDLFVELDFNAAELRTMLALAGKEQPEEDIHEWNMQNVFSRIDDRENAKKKAFQWLYGKTSANKTLEEVYDKEKIKKDWFHHDFVRTPFGRAIECDEDHAINYVIQSTTADVVYENTSKINELLENRKTYVAFIIHDCIVLDMSKKDLDLIDDLVDTFSSTRFGDFKSSIKAGKTLGNLKEIPR
jgi:hypothetical protein